MLRSSSYRKQWGRSVISARTASAWTVAITVAAMLLAAAPEVRAQSESSQKVRSRPDFTAKSLGGGAGVPGDPDPEGQLHGVLIAKSCTSPMKVGDITDCEIVIGYNDDFGDTLTILSAFDIVDPDGDSVRIPPVGDLEIITVAGNTTAVVGGSLPVNIGPPGSTLGGLPGLPEPGFVTFRQNSYLIQADDPDPLPDQANVLVMDLCDAPGTSACSSIPNLVQFTAATDIINPAIGLEKTSDAPSICEGVPTDVTFTFTVTNEGDVPLENIVLTDSICGEYTVPDSGDVDGDLVLDLAEVFIDLNSNGVWDPGEPIIADNGNGVWDDTEVWTFECMLVIDTETFNAATVTSNAINVPECIAEAAAELTITTNPVPSCLISGPVTPVCPATAGIIYNATETSVPPIAGVTFDWVLTGDALFGNGMQTFTGPSALVNADNVCDGSYSLSVTVTTPDDCVNTCALGPVTIIDDTPPTFTVFPDDTTVECDGTGNIGDLIAFLGQPAASDDCGDAVVTNDFAGGPDLCGATSEVTVTFTATDACGNESTASAMFTIADTIPPVYTDPPTDVTVECDGSGNLAALAAFLADPDASDVCGNVTITDDFAGLSDLCGATGSATVTFTATDECGNATPASATFTIADTTPPFVTTAAVDVTVECDGSGNISDLDDFLNQVEAIDACGAVTITNDFTGLSDLCGATGAATVTFTATDDCGNPATSTATFTIEDTTDPFFTVLPQDATVECDGNGNPDEFSAFLSQGEAADACGNATIQLGPTGLSPGCGETGVAVVTFFAVDECGNDTTAIATFRIEDTTPPAFDTDPADVTVECDGSGNIADLNAFLAQGAASDTCGPVTEDDDFAGLSDLCGATGSATVTFTATDDCGNESTDTATFTIVDTAPPAITCDDVTVECDGQGNLADLAAFLDGCAASDLCSEPVTITNDFTGLVPGCGATGSA
ncbi:MAG: hypothetical protein GY715_12385, partial [Planctomycetes bacterium]|nr:hypothetical protein [Planctomycetota bacterium]